MTNANLQSDVGSASDVIVFSDLDGTLLGHDDYSFAAAKPALKALAEHDIPVVATTSKTLAELASLNPELGLSATAIAENGAVIKFADGSVDCAVSRAAIGQALTHLPNTMRRAMQCFCDMQIDQIGTLTGLDVQAAAQAATREASEPFLWHGDVAALADMQAALAKMDLHVTQGGRFFHIVPRRDKAAAMATVLARYAVPPHSWALGDGPNDVAMLLAADLGALIANRHLDTQRALPIDHRLYLASGEGPAGWRDAIAVFLEQYFG